jgi:hypothetical protein
MCIFIKKSLVQKEIHMKKIIFTLTVFLMFAQLMQGQVLISLLLGDKLNSEKLKFGLDGGANFSTITNAGATKYNTGFDLGFYFDFLLKKDKPWYVHTGVLVKSPMGANGLSPYHLTNADSTALDTLFANGGVERNLRYFNVPVLVRYKFKFDMFVELGIMMGLMYKAYDEFYTEIDNKKDLTFQNDVRDLYKRFDVGGMAGIGYHFSKGTGTDIGFRYYYGFMDMLKDNPGLAQRNSAFYLYVAIPIGAGEKAKAKQAESKKKKAAKKAEKDAKEKN